MSQTKLEKRVANIQAFCRKKHPEPVTYRQVAVKFSIGFTLATNLSKAAAETHSDYEYDSEGLRFTGNPDEEDIKAYLDEKEAREESLKKSDYSIPASEAWRIRNILEAKPVKQEDKGSLKMPKKPISEWTPDENENRTNQTP